MEHLKKSLEIFDEASKKETKVKLHLKNLVDGLNYFKENVSKKVIKNTATKVSQKPHNVEKN